MADELTATQHPSESLGGTIQTSGSASISSQNQSKSTFLEHYGSTVLGQGAVLGLGVLTGILSARILGPVGRGEYVAVCIWPTWIATVLYFGINQAVVFNIGRRAFTVSEVATAATTIGFVQSALSILIGLVLVRYTLARYSFEAKHLGLIFVLFTPALILSAYTSNFFQGLQDLLHFNIIRVIPAFTYFLGLTGLFLFHRSSLNGVIYSQLAGYAMALAIGWVLVWTALRPHWQWNRLAIPRLIDYGYRIQATNLASLFNQRIDQLILSLIIPPRQLGFYAVAVTLSTSVTVFSVAVGVVTFSHGSNQDSEHAKATIGRSFRASLIWLLLACSALYAFAPFLIRLVFGPAFEGSILACRILLPGAVMIGMNQVLYNGSSALGRPGLPSCAEGVSMAVTAVGLYLLVPHYGYIGAAIVSSIAYTISFLVMLVLAQRLLGLNIRTLLFYGSPSAPNPTTVHGE
jgi:O-antigen/teichoic acid export membrane protein